MIARVLAILVLASVAHAAPKPPPPEDRPDADMMKVIAAQATAFRTCQQREPNRDAKARGGRLVLDIQVGADGKVRDVTFGAKTTVTSEPIKSCAKGIAMKLVFPAKGAIKTVSAELVYGGT